MLQKLSEQIADCYRYAADCRRKADAAIVPTEKREFLEIERRWVFLARSYEFTERLTDFTNTPKVEA
jgi:hypothetical protein